MEGLGEDAWWQLVQADVIVGTLTVCLSDANLTLTLSGGPDAKGLRGAAQRLAATAIERIA